MTRYSHVGWIFKVLAWLVAIVFVSFTASPVRQSLGDVFYVFNSALLLFGGTWLGERIDRIVSRF